MHKVSQGECLSSIATKYGFSEWRAIFDHPDNAGLRRKRPNPNVLFPGDEIAIPDKESKAIACATGLSHRFVVKRPKTRVRIQLCNGTGTPYGGKRYKLTVEGAAVEGMTDAEGMVDQPVPPDAREGELVLWPSDDAKTMCRFKLALGALDPAGELTGAIARLANLGFAILGAENESASRGALREFQQAHGLEVTGALDAATSAKLRQLHDE